MGLLDTRTFNNDTRNYFDQSEDDDGLELTRQGIQPYKPAPGAQAMPGPASGSGMLPSSMLPSGKRAINAAANGADGNQWIPPSERQKSDGMGPGERFNAMGKDSAGPLGPNPNYGQMQGYLLAQNELRARAGDRREEDANARANDTQGMTREAFGWKRDEVEKERSIQSGMKQAAQAGGYEGVIAFLEKNDPERAVKFTDAKLDLDSKIMNNNVMRDIKIPLMKQEALLESYGILGKMGAALIQAPADQRQKLYDTLLPIAQKVNPDMPKNLEDALPVFLLSAAQATPANQLFKYGQQTLTAESTIGKLDADYRSRLKAGVPSTDPTMVAIKSELDKHESDALQARLKLTNTKIEQNQSIQDQQLKLGKIADTISGELSQASKGTLDYFPAYVKARSALETLKKDPTNTAAQNQLGVGFVKGIGNTGNFSETEQEQKYSAAGFPNLWKKIKSAASGQKVELSPTEVKVLETQIDSTAHEIVKSQKSIEDAFRASTMKAYANQVDWKAVRKPSEQFENYMYGQDVAKTIRGGEVPAEIAAKAQRAISAGVHPDRVKQLIASDMQKIVQSNPIETPQITPETYYTPEGEK